MATSYDHEHRDVVVSTQDETRAAFSGTPMLVTAGRQTGGRGRGGHHWEHAPRAVAASLALRPEGAHQAWRPESLAVIPLAAGLAVLDVLDDERVGLKWPNDMVVDDRKVGGLLAETTREVVIVGCGVNLWWPDAPEGITGLELVDPGPEAATRVALEWAVALLERLSAGPDAWGLDEYRAACSTVGRDVVWDPGGRGTAIGIDGDGSLEVRTPDGDVVRLRSGEVRTVRPRG